MDKKHLLVILFLFVTLVGCANNGTQPQQIPSGSSGDMITLVYAVHWLEDNQINGIYENGVLKSKGLKQYLDEYHSLHPNINITILQIPYGEYPTKLQLLHDADTAPDIYQIYSTWGVSLARAGVLDTPPQYIRDDVLNNYVSTAGVTIDGSLRGIPTEVNTYSLVYNKKMFKEAGIVDAAGNAKPPRTWDELVSDASLLTKKDPQGHFVQYGFAFLKGLDWGVVDPFLALLFSNNGKYVSNDLKTPLFNSTAGVEALDAQLRLFNQGSTSINAVVWGFANKDAAMIIVAPWTKAALYSGFNESFNDDVGVAPMPYMQTPATLQYSWFMGVMNKSSHKDEAWKFLLWFTSDVQPETKTTRYGDLLAQTIGAIPSRKIDVQNHANILNDQFTKAFVESLPFSVPEPNVVESAAVKIALMQHIQAAWIGDESSKDALDAAAGEIARILNGG